MREYGITRDVVLDAIAMRVTQRPIGVAGLCSTFATAQKFVSYAFFDVPNIICAAGAERRTRGSYYWPIGPNQPEGEAARDLFLAFMLTWAEENEP